MTVDALFGTGFGYFLIFLVGVVCLNLWRWRSDRVVALKFREQQREGVRLQHTPKVSILVAAWNESAGIKNHLNSIKNLSYPAKEMILCAGGRDNTFAVASQFANDQIRVMEQVSGEGKQRALERAYAFATGEIVFLTDADCVLNDASFAQTLSPLINDGEKVATGYAAPLDQQRSILLVRSQWYVDHYSRAFSPDYVGGLIGRNAAIVRTTLDNVGAFSQPVKIGTDYFLAQKLLAAGERIRHVRSTVETEFKASIQPYFRQQSRWLRNILLHGQQFKNYKQVRHALLQCLIGAGVVLWTVALPFLGWFGVWVWLLVIAYGTLSRFRYIRFGELSLGQPRLWALYLLAPAHFLIDQLMLTYALLEWLLPSRRWQW
jgi:cellulose synthase/poly-beta-1,6-N-acetylglucosamine synthase-like glycosyltransferase